MTDMPSDDLIPDVNSPNLIGQLLIKVAVLETTLWGKSGTNGMRSEIQGIRDDQRDMRIEFNQKLDKITESIEKRDEKEEAERVEEKRHNWSVWLALAGIIVAFGTLIVLALTYLAPLGGAG